MTTYTKQVSHLNLLVHNKCSRASLSHQTCPGPMKEGGRPHSHRPRPPRRDHTLGTAVVVVVGGFEAPRPEGPRARPPLSPPLGA